MFVSNATSGNGLRMWLSRWAHQVGVNYAAPRHSWLRPSPVLKEPPQLPRRSRCLRQHPGPLFGTQLQTKLRKRLPILSKAQSPCPRVLALPSVLPGPGCPHLVEVTNRPAGKAFSVDCRSVIEPRLTSIHEGLLPVTAAGSCCFQLSLPYPAPGGQSARLNFRPRKSGRSDEMNRQRYSSLINA